MREFPFWHPWPDPDTVRHALLGLKKEHPRLILLDEEVPRVKQTLTRSRRAAGWWTQLKREAADLLVTPPVTRKEDDTGHILEVSRTVLRRVELLALVYRLEGDRRMALRARDEMLAAAAFADWDPGHFLDCAEMTMALAIGYDWLYRELSDADRRTIEEAILRKGIAHAIVLYRRHRGFVKQDHNWNQVCNSGMVIGALALATVHPRMASEVIVAAVESLERSMRWYSPDGGWAEGPGYWSYATRTLAPMLASLDTALGFDLGIAGANGFFLTGLFALHFTGPTRLTFNFADAPDHEQSAPQLFWLSRRLDCPLYAWIERQKQRGPDPLDIVWFDERGEGPSREGIAPDAEFRGVDVAFLRSSWDDPQALYVGFKGGRNDANHSHLDLGTFVLDALGQRWAIDLGPDSYALPGYFDRANQRYGYFRLSTRGHNTITLDGANQAKDARAPIEAFTSSPTRSFAIVNLSAAYVPAARSVRRGVAMLEHRAVLVQDEVQGSHAVRVDWRMFTRAQVLAAGRTAILSAGGVFLHARILEPDDALFRKEAVEITPPQQSAEGVSCLRLKIPTPRMRTRIAVLLTPSTSDQPPVDHLQVEPLDRWVSR